MKQTLSLLSLLFATQIAVAAPTLIAGQVKNGSAANRPLAGAEVQLIRPANPTKMVMRTTLAKTRTDAQGRFVFPAREYAKDDLLMANIARDGFDYPVVAYDGGQKLKQVGISVNSKKVELLVFDTTTDPVPLDFQAHHLAVSKIENGSIGPEDAKKPLDSPVKNGIHCIERIVVHNHSTSTFLGVGPRRITVLLDLPKAAKNVKLDPKITDATLIQTPNGWGIVRPITPDAYGAQNALIVSYQMEWPSSLPWAKTVSFDRKTVYPTKFFFVARTNDDKDLKVTAPKLSSDSEAEIPIEGKTEVRLVNSLGAPMMPQGGAPPALGAGQDLQISVSKPVSPTFWGFAAMTIALCLFVPVAMIKPRRKGSSPTDIAAPTQAPNFAEPPLGALVIEQSSGTGPFSTPQSDLASNLTLDSQSRDLIQKIADLDDRREAGQVEESEYQSQRAAWKSLLIESLGATPSNN